MDGLGHSQLPSGLSLPTVGPDGLAKLLLKNQMMTAEAANRPRPSGSQPSLPAFRKPLHRSASSGLKTRALRPTFIDLPTQSFASLNLPPAPLTSPGATALRGNEAPRLSPLAQNPFKAASGPWTGPSLLVSQLSPSTGMTPRRFSQGPSNMNPPTPTKHQIDQLQHFQFAAPQARTIPIANQISPQGHNPYFPSLQELESLHHQPALLQQGMLDQDPLIQHMSQTPRQ